VILKLTVLLLAACLADLCLRRATAALRHLTWTLATGCSLLLPLAHFYAPRIADGAFVIHTSVEAATWSAPAGRSWLMGIYLTGVAWLLLRLALDIAAANRLVRDSRPGKCPGVRVSRTATVPFAWGEIVVPEGFEDRPTVIAHEAAHLRRGDVWTALLARVACAVYWFHPLVWWAAARMRLEADRSCDDAVLRHGFAGTSYAQDLVDAAGRFTSPRLAPGAISEPQLEVRLRHILANGVDRRSPGITRSLLAIVAGAALLSLLAAVSSPIYKVGQGIVAPKVLSKVEPVYTQHARAAKIHGPVILAVVIGTDGRAREFQVKKTIDTGLSDNAIEAIRKWKFQPGMRDGKPVNVKAVIEVNFRLL
jgi:TonB family protein